MPIYLYEHIDPGSYIYCNQPKADGPFTFEVEQSIKDEPLKECPSCLKGVKRLIAGSVLVNWKNGAAPTPKTYS